MVDFEIMTAKLAALDRHVAQVRKHSPLTADALRADQDRTDLVSFNLMLALQTCLDLAAHLIADQEWTPTAKSADAFARLEAHGVLTHATAGALSKAVGVRNLIAHAYGVVDLNKLHSASREGLSDLERFAEELSRWATDR